MAILLAIEDKKTGSIAPQNGEMFSVQELQGYVGGYIEAVRLDHKASGMWMIVNEEGLLQNLPHNPAASILAMRYIVGNAVVATFKELNGREEWEPEDSEEEEVEAE
jgi:hypothetical protein